MKDIEKFIIENAGAFSQMEPLPGHLQKFEKKLQRKKELRLYNYFAPALKIASVTLVVTVSSIWLFNNLIKDNEPDVGMSLGQVSPELMEVENYFISKIEGKYTEIKTLDLESYNLQKEILLKELEEMNQLYESLKIDLYNRPENDKIINAMIQYYILKAEVLKQILKQLREIETSIHLKTTVNENNEI